MATFVIGLLVALYGHVTVELSRQWLDDSNYSHCFLVPLFSAVLLWRRRHALLALTPQGDWLGLPVLAAGVGARVLGDIGGEQFLMRSSLIVVLAGAVLFHFGRRAFRLVAFPVLFLFFMIPLPATVFYAIAFPLQSLAARNAAWVLDLLGVPVLLEGNVIHLSQISLGITEACSGIRSLVSLLVVSLAWGYVALPASWATAVLTASAVPITVVANAARVVVTGLIGQWFGVEYAQGVYHTFSGWLIFLFAFVCLLGVFATVSLWLRQRGVTT